MGGDQGTITEVSEGLVGLAEYTFLGSEVRHWGHVGSLRRRADRIVKETCCGPGGSETCNTLTLNRGRAVRSDPVARCPEMKWSRFAGGKSAVTRPRSDDIIMFGSGSASRSKQALD